MMGLLDLLSPRVSRQHGDAATGDPGTNTVGAGCQDDGYTRAEYETGAVGIGKETEQLGQDVGRLEIRCEKNVGIAGDLRANSLCFGGLLADGVVKGQWAVEKALGDLPAFSHLAQGGGVQGRRHFRIHCFDGGKNGYLWLRQAK